MKKWVAFGILVLLMSGCAVGHKTESITPGTVEAEQVRAAEVHAVYPTVLTLGELTQKAPIVVVGTIQGLAGTRNLARDPANPTKPDPTLEITGIDYKFHVQTYLKGTGDSDLLVTEAKSITYKGPGQDQTPVPYKGFREMPAGGQYILFLRQTTDGSGRWIGIAEPWRFSISGSRVIVKSRWDEAEQYFPESTDKAFRDAVLAAIR